MLVLRDYQKIAVDNCISDLKIHNRIGLILPTGAGKTVCFIEIAKKFIEENPQKSVLVLSHLSILTDQTKERFERFCPELELGVMQANTYPGVFDQVIIGTMQSLSKEKKSKYLKTMLIKKTGLIIVDEAHYLETNSYDKCIAAFPEAKVIGVTATPIRKNKFMTNYFEKVSHSISLQELIDAGHLVRPNLIQIERDSNELDDVMAMMLKAYKNREDGKSGIIFMRTVDEAKAIRNSFQDIGVKAECLSFDMPKDLRNDYIRRYNSGDIKILSCVDIISTGFDSSLVFFIFLPYGTGSSSKYMQRIGRGLRTDHERGKQFCNIYMWGESPRIQSGFFKRLSNIALNENGKIKEYPTFSEEFELNDYDTRSNTYTYTSLIVDTIKKMHQLDLPNLAAMLNAKEFPKRFMEKLTTLNDGLPIKPIFRKSNSQPTDKQKQFLTSYSFTNQQVDKINRYEATTMISAILGNAKNSQDIIPSGRFKGYHISQIPFSYRKIILEKYSGSAIAAMIHSWENRNKSA